MKKSIYLLSAFLIILGLFFSYLLFFPSVSQSQDVFYYVKPGTSKKTLIAELSQLQLIRMPTIFSWLIYFQNNATLKTGEYVFPKGSSPFSIWRQVTHGKGLLYRPFTIIPGWTFNQLRQALNQTDGLKHTIATLSDQDIMKQLGNATLAPEGEFFPDTYNYTKGIADMVILKRAFLLMQKQLISNWMNKASNLPFKTPYEALIAASLIEKEAYLDTERQMISGVLINRLRDNMPLQFDPTVIYGMGERYQGKIHKADLAENTPYNTYVHNGLPPTPIAMPSLDSLMAALHPQENDFYYFVARGDGSHQFSKTLSEHHQAVQDAIKNKISYFNNELIRQHINVILNSRLNMIAFN